MFKIVFDNVEYSTETELRELRALVLRRMEARREDHLVRAREQLAGEVEQTRLMCSAKVSECREYIAQCEKDIAKYSGVHMEIVEKRLTRLSRIAALNREIDLLNAEIQTLSAEEATITARSHEEQKKHARATKMLQEGLKEQDECSAENMVHREQQLLEVHVEKDTELQALVRMNNMLNSM